MGLWAEIQKAAEESHGILARMTGMAEDAAGNTLLPNGSTVLGVYSAPRVTWLPVISGGYRKRTEVTLTITRTQIAQAPAPNTKLTRKDIDPQITYTIDHVNSQGSLSYELTLVNFVG